METLNDIGASEFLGVRTLTVSIYTTWITRSDLPGASQIALSLLIVVVALVALEKWARAGSAIRAAPSAAAPSSRAGYLREKAFSSCSQASCRSSSALARPHSIW